jgi:hypothetical protein
MGRTDVCMMVVMKLLIAKRVFVVEIRVIVTCSFRA